MTESPQNTVGARDTAKSERDSWTEKWHSVRARMSRWDREHFPSPRRADFHRLSFLSPLANGEIRSSRLTWAVGLRPSPIAPLQCCQPRASSSKGPELKHTKQTSSTNQSRPHLRYLTLHTDIVQKYWQYYWSCKGNTGGIMTNNE